MVGMKQVLQVGFQKVLGPCLNFHWKTLIRQQWMVQKYGQTVLQYKVAEK